MSNSGRLTNACKGGGTARWSGGIAFLTLCAALAGCGGKKDAPPPQAPPVAVATPLPRQVVDWDEFVGRFEAVDSVEVRPRVSGYVQSIHFRDGELVKKGQLLFIIDPRPYQAALSQAHAEVIRAQASAANAKAELARAEKLVAQTFLSASAYESRLAQSRSADAAVAAAQAAERSRALDLSFTKVTSPLSGRVSDRRVSAGNLVTAEGTPTVLTTVVSLDPIRFAFSGSEAVYLKYQRANEAGTRQSSRYAANPVDIRLQDETDYAWRGRMDFVDNAMDGGSGTIRGRAVVANPHYLLTPGMYGRMRLLGSGAYTALLIPDQAVMADQSDKIAFVVGADNVVQPKKLVLGPIVDGLRVIRSGLAPTDRVVIEGAQRVRPGVKVSPQAGKITPAAATAPRPEVLTQPSSTATSAPSAQ